MKNVVTIKEASVISDEYHNMVIAYSQMQAACEYMRKQIIGQNIRMGLADAKVRGVSRRNGVHVKADLPVAFMKFYPEYKNGMSRNEFAKQVGVSYPTITRWISIYENENDISA